MVKTIQEALSPLLIISSFCGLSFFEYPLGQIRPYLSCLYFLVTWSFFVYLFYYLVSVTNNVSMIVTWDTIIIYSTAIISMFISLFRFKELKICLVKLSIVNDTLEKLGMPKEYQRLYNWTIRVIIGWIAIACFMNVMDIFWLDYEYFNIARICLPFVINHLFHVDTIKDLTWGTILGYTSSRFQRINERIHNLLQDDAEYIREETALIIVPREHTRTNTKECCQLLWIIMHIHLQLSRISRELNEVFSIQMTLQMASYFTFIVKLLYDFYMFYINKDMDTFDRVMENITFYAWGVVYVTKLIALNHICHTVYDKANETIAILHKLSNNTLDNGLREQMLQFVLQIKQREVQFSGMGLFYFGYSFIRRFFMSVSTVLVILIQMQVSNNDTNNEAILSNTNHTNYTDI